MAHLVSCARRNWEVAEVLTQVKSLLDEGEEVTDVAKTLSIKSNNLNKAILDGCLHKSVKKDQPSSQQTASSKSEHNAIDSVKAILTG